MVETVLGAHEDRNRQTAEEFKTIDAAENGMLDRGEIEMYFNFNSTSPAL